MAVEKKLTKRDETLVKVLDRLSEDISKQQDLVAETNKKQLELAADIERHEARHSSQYGAADQTIEKTHEALIRYRSDMLSLVNEQDRINEAMKELNKKQITIAYSQDNIVNALTNIDKRLEMHEKIIHDLNESTAHYETTLSGELAQMNRHIAKQHLETEKRLDEVNRETQKRLSELNQDTMRRLKSLDEVESALNVLLIRTQPREKKPFFLLRLFNRIKRLPKVIRRR